MPPKAARQDDLIFDIGMDAGEDTNYYLAKGFRVVAVEANPAVCEETAKRHAAAISQGRLTIVNRAISQTCELLAFYVCETNSAWSTSSPRLRDYWRGAAGAVFREIRVDAVTTPELVERFGVPYYAKIDIEGSDLLCLDGFARCAIRPQYVSLEVDFRCVEDIIRSATGLGYRHFSLVGQRSVPQQKPPRPAREGIAVDHTFTLFSSGLFGRELPATWGNALHLRAKCRAVILQHRANRLLRLAAPILPRVPLETLRRKYLPLAGDWYDVHASL